LPFVAHDILRVPRSEMLLETAPYHSNTVVQVG
jgi:hypothetical protein